MIEVKNKRIILYPADRLIGAEGDIETAKRVFSIDKIENGCDLSNLVAWIKLNPVGSGEAAYNQKLKKEIVGDKIHLTWTLTGANLKNAGELEAQIIMAAPDYFSAADLDSLNGNSPVMPSVVSGVSAPVWQSFKETFVIAESIDDAIAYSEVNKNVLISAVADATAAADSSLEALAEVRELESRAGAAKFEIEQLYRGTKECVETADYSAQKAQNYASNALASSEQASVSAQLSKDFATQCEENLDKTEEYKNSAALSANEVQEIYGKVEQVSNDVYFMRDETIEFHNMALDEVNRVRNAVTEVQKARNFRKIFSKTISAEDEGCVSFEINSDEEGNALCLSDFVVFAYFPATPNAASTYLRLEAMGEGYTVYSLLAQYIGMSKTAGVYSRVECKNLGRWASKITKGSSWFENAEATTNLGTICSQQRNIDGKPVVSVRLTQRTNPVAFPVGTVFELWARDYMKTEE